MDLKSLRTSILEGPFPLTWPGHWIHNEWRSAKRNGPTKTSMNPNNHSPLVDVWSDKDSLQSALDSSHSVRQTWARMPLEERLEGLSRFRSVLSDNQESMIWVLRLEAGKCRWEAEDELRKSLDYLDHVIKDGSMILDQLLAPARLGPQKSGLFSIVPIGITAAYLPFSTPLSSFVFYQAAATLAGCPLILNSSSHAVLTGMLLALLTREADWLPGATNVLFTHFAGFKNLLADKRIAAVLYMGSREHCDMIRMESKPHVGRQTVLQSGGKNAVIVHNSADLDLAVKVVLTGALTSAGQRCTSTSRVFIYRSHFKSFSEKLVEALKNVPIGRTDLPFYPSSMTSKESQGPLMGPLYSEKAVEKYLRFQTMAHRESEKTLLWGKLLETESRGYFVTPSVHVPHKFDNQSAYQGNVLFGPDLALYEYDVLDTAILQMNTTDAAFAVSFVGDPDVIEKRRHLFLAPNLILNAPTVEEDATLPLAGRLQSGHHRFHGPGIALYLCYPQVVHRSTNWMGKSPF